MKCSFSKMLSGRRWTDVLKKGENPKKIPVPEKESHHAQAIAQ